MSNSLTYLNRTYYDDEIKSGSVARKQSLNLAELTVDTAEFTLKPIVSRDFITHDPYDFITNDNYEFCTTESNPLYGGFTQNTPVAQSVDGSQVAVWFLQDKTRIGKNDYTLSTFSSIGRLTQRTHYGGVYNGVAASTIIASICGNIPYYINPVFENVLMYGWLPIATARDNLQQVLFALNANLRTDANGTLRIENLPDSVQTQIPASSIYANNASVKYNTPVTSIVVLEHKYTPGTETRELFNGTTTGTQTVTFNEPIEASTLTATSGLTIVESGENYANVTGTGVLTGTPYVHTTREVSKAVSTADIENVVRIESATLVGESASADVANRLKEYYLCRNSINVSAANNTTAAGDVVSVYDPYDEQMVSACVESSQSTLSATHKTTISALAGYTPWQQVAFDDVYDIIDTSGTYTFPATIQPNTDVTVILIGGGQGGTNGANGQNGKGYSATAYSPNIKIKGVSINVPAGEGGNGGANGVKGNGGKILRFSMTVNPSDAFSVVIGAGGASGGNAGGNTTVAGYSSANGSVSADGYFDSVNERYYALPGVDGIAGGNGGNGGSSGSNGLSGGSASTNVGGVGGTGISRSNPKPILSIGGGGGSGASSASNGNVGGNAQIVQEISGRGDYASTGANGVNGATKSAPTLYGAGGNGGDGGSGGGGAGAGSINNPADSSYYENPVTITFTGNGGTGGLGSAGTAGHSGCAIFIYRKPA